MAVVLLSCSAAVAAGAEGTQARGIVVLADTGRTRDGVPVLTRHPEPGPIVDVLTRGFSGRLLHLYQLEQTYLYRAGQGTAEPAYLLLSDKQGGFPRVGFYLDDEYKRGVGYVDLHRRSQLAGRFGAVDQIFPHELLHVIVRQLAGEPGEGGANQVHAIGVRTDPQMALAEGLAEHVQIMAVDDPDADGLTRALGRDEALRMATIRDLDAYARELSACWAPASRMRMRFLFWFSQREQVLRYHAVKANLFMRSPEIASRLLARQDPYAAYLLTSILPGDPTADPKAVGVALSTEGVVAHLFWRWASTRAIQARYRDGAFYERFGTSAGQVSPLENVYLKLFHAIFLHRPHDTVSVIDGYRRTFPDEAAEVDDIVSRSLEGQRLTIGPEIWLANIDFQTGTTLFDQFRSLPRPHTFDVNAASVIDWLGVPGVRPELAARLVKAAPYASLGEVGRVPGVDATFGAKLADMAAAMQRLRAKSGDRESSLSVWGLFRPFIWRAAIVWLLASVVACALYQRVRGARWRTALAAGLVASALVLAFTWVIVGPVWLPPLLIPAVTIGIPMAVWRVARRRAWSQIAYGLAAWVAAAVPAALSTQAWF